jgi:acetyl/propionyl-CoA carboxylase alpha subunit
VHYDPILAKVAVHAVDRPAAIARLVRALEDCVVLGVATPIEFLLDVLRAEPFAAGRTHTRFLDEHFADWRPGDRADDAALVGFVLDRLAGPGTATVGAPLPGVPDALSPWQRLGAWGRRV